MLLPFLTNKLYHVKRWSADSTSPSPDTTYEPANSLDEANIVSSLLTKKALVFDDDAESYRTEDVHTPVLDIDVPAALVDSSTPGKHHLYIDAEMTWEQYVKLLDVMAEVGILEEGYVGASKARGFTAVRLPWIRK